MTLRVVVIQSRASSAGTARVGQLTVIGLCAALGREGWVDSGGSWLTSRVVRSRAPGRREYQRGQAQRHGERHGETDQDAYT
jgi:hypothetical protein